MWLFVALLIDFEVIFVAESSPAQENHVTEPETSELGVVDGEEVYNPPENEQASVEEEEAPVPEVVDETSDGWQMVAESNSKIEEVPKKSYAYIVSGHQTKSYVFYLFLICFVHKSRSGKSLHVGIINSNCPHLLFQFLLLVFLLLRPCMVKTSLFWYSRLRF